MSSVLPSLICMASRCSLQTYAISCCSKHAQLGFPLRTANMCNFLLQREQDTMLPLILSHPMFLREIGSRQTKKRAALSFCLCWQGWFEDAFSLQCIPPRYFYRIRMNFSVGNHPSQTFLANQDESHRKKSSLDEYSCKSG